ncbi:MAG: hypothetical protein IPM08_15200 [Actinomycetales bacterium]|nr:hypothetical protein [Actinomycetales bacterium]
MSRPTGECVRAGHGRLTAPGARAIAAHENEIGVREERFALSPPGGIRVDIEPPDLVALGDNLHGRREPVICFPVGR